MAVNRDSELLLALPEVVLREVFSWSPDGATAHALLSTCRTSHQLRQDPAAAALLLTRCPCRDYGAALASFTQCQGGAGAVVQQVLQLLQASPDSGGPSAAPAALLQAALQWAATHGDTAAIGALLATPHPPDVNAGHGAALLAAMLGGPHLAAMQALFDGGAVLHPYSPALERAAESPARQAALQLLLQHCPPDHPLEVIEEALRAAVEGRNLAAATLLVPVFADGGGDSVDLLLDAAHAGEPAVLQLVLSLGDPTDFALNEALMGAASGGSAACAAALLECGADANAGDHGNSPLSSALPGQHVAPERVESHMEVVRLLLSHGADVTPHVRFNATLAALGARDELAVLLL